MTVASSIYYTEASRWFMEQLLALEPDTENGGIYADKKGYHNTYSANAKKWPGNYSITDSVDKSGPHDKAAGYDWTFHTAQNGNYTRIALYTNRLLVSAKDLNDPRLNGWREFYGQSDNDLVVEGWDTRYGVSATSDSSHLWHIHLSETRSLVESWTNKKAMLSVLKGETTAQWKAGLDMTVKFFRVKETGLIFSTSFSGTYYVYMSEPETKEAMLAAGLQYGEWQDVSNPIMSAYGVDIRALAGLLSRPESDGGDQTTGALTSAQVQEIVHTEIGKLVLTMHE